jgi:hypothetical protein
LKRKSRENDKVTSEKPVSLDPVPFEDALRALLSIPPSKEPLEEERKHRQSKKKKPSSD